MRHVLKRCHFKFQTFRGPFGPLGAQKPLKLSAAEMDLGDYKTERLKCSTSRYAMLENGAVSSFKSIGAHLGPWGPKNSKIEFAAETDLRHY